MFNRLLTLLMSCFLIYGCSSTSRVKARYTADDKTVFDLIERLKKNPNDADAAKLLPEAYKQAAQVRKALNANSYDNMNPGDRWMEISKQLLVAEQMYTDIKAAPAASKAVPNPWDPTLKIQNAKLNAAGEYYDQGLEYLNYNNRPYAQKAYDMFAKANAAYPNYMDVKNKMAQATDLATVKVLVMPVNYYSFGWNYWGFQNDYLQYKIVRDLNNSSYRDVRFYTNADINLQHLQADRVVELNFTELNVGQVYTDDYTINRSKKIKAGETKSIPAQPIYETVNATLYVKRSIMQSRASLECRIFDRATNNNILYDRFPDNYTWKQESARFTGDRRPLESSDLMLINNSGNVRLPTRNEIAQRLVDNCYSLLLSRIRNGVNF
ncbi:MAG TPA: hypothetical protein VIJ75_07110 [Hanamia sp.]